MDSTLIPGRPVNINDLTLEHRPVPADQVAAGTPTTGLNSLGRFGGLGLGVWEMSAGGMHDIEAEELFLVVSGNATVVIHHDAPGGAASRIIELAAGSLMHLTAGMRTTWTVHEPLRKVHLAP
ncbi:cupin domain-containing protein [Arthrobacter sp. I2-34]|uniref:Cupin domain-containing protein n=1 Tax=Arthrobacter hankyongi TaxID=2904801 RepID=A0ABS9LDR2_9MICC|nr:cupin domain-containing protein [Arthrobacter hankyongi]MCG2624827.1 cupin domain-containing protein [Arthrobacter hankyongi]